MSSSQATWQEISNLESQANKYVTKYLEALRREEAMTTKVVELKEELRDAVTAKEFAQALNRKMKDLITERFGAQVYWDLYHKAYEVDNV